MLAVAVAEAAGEVFCPREFDVVYVFISAGSEIFLCTVGRYYFGRNPGRLWPPTVKQDDATFSRSKSHFHVYICL